ncbi:MAG TPA: DUF2155 domain-containing protein [Xanthobacteraceae bacterium]
MPRLQRLSRLATVLVLTSAAPAAAQFGNIFNAPPRPPGDIPYRDERLPPLPRSDPRQDLRQDPGAYDPRLERYDPREAPTPPPPPLTRLPSPGSPPPGVQTQPLPPPPGTAPPAQQDAVVPPGAAPPALPGLPPGQRQPRGTPGQTLPGAPTDEVVVAPPAQKVVNPTAVFAGLDKITGRIISFDVAMDETVQFGALRMTPRACYTRPPTETPNTDGFVEVDEITLQGEVKRVFTGWMFATSPGLHGVEHPIYDVWLTDCKKEPPSPATVPGVQAQRAEPAAAPAPPPAPAAAPPVPPAAAPPPAPAAAPRPTQPAPRAPAPAPQR